MTEKTIEQKVKEIISGQLGKSQEEISLDSKINEDLGADSLDAIEIIMHLEDAYESKGLKISDEDLQKLRTVGDIVNYITEKLKY